MGIVFKNNAKTTLGSSLTNSATSATVTDGSVFPSLAAGEFFFCTFDDGTNNEIVKVTARSSNTLTIVRAQESTTARAFSSGDAAELRLTAGVLETIQENIAAKSANQTVFNATTSGGATSYDIGIDPGVEANAMVFLDGVMQHHDTFSFSSSTLTFDAAPVNGTKLEVIVDNLINLQSSNLTVDSFTAADVSGSPQTDFTLSDTPAAETNLIVFVDGVFQDQDAYTISTNTLTITTGVIAGRGVTVYIINPVNIGTPSDGTVTSAKLSGNITMPGTLTVGSNDVAFDSPTFVVDNSNSRVGLGTASPSVPVDIVGDVKMSANLTVDTSTLVVDSSNNRVGIGVTPSAKLHVVGSEVLFDNTGGDFTLKLNTNAVGDKNEIIMGDTSTPLAKFGVGGTADDIITGSDGQDFNIGTAGGGRAINFSTDNFASIEMKLDGGNVGIGTTSPSSKLSVKADQENLIDLQRTTTTTGAAYTKFINDGGNYYIGVDSSAANRLFASGGAAYALSLSTESARDICLGTNNTERMRILANGTLLVGKTADNNTVGFKTNTSSSYMVSSGETPFFINRLSDDGNLIEFRKDSSTVGQIGTYGGAFYLGGGTGSNAGGLMFNGTDIEPTTGSTGRVDGTISLGSANYGLNSVVMTRLGLGQTAAGSSVGHTASENEGIFWHNSKAAYGIWRTSGAWSASDYSQLKLDWDTGIILDGGNAYGKSGVRIHDQLVLALSGGNERNFAKMTTMGYNAAYRAINIGSAGATVSTNDALGSASLAFNYDVNTNSSGASWGGTGNELFFRRYASFLTPNSTNNGWFVQQTMVDGVTSGDFNDTSDLNLKTNVNTISNGLDVILKLNPVTFDWKQEEKGNGVGGFIAQEVNKILPNDVTGEELEVGERGEHLTTGLSINTNSITAHLVKAIQEQQAVIEDLKTRIETLEG